MAAKRSPVSTHRLVKSSESVDARPRDDLTEREMDLFSKAAKQGRHGARDYAMERRARPSRTPWIGRRTTGSRRRGAPIGRLSGRGEIPGGLPCAAPAQATSHRWTTPPPACRSRRAYTRPPAKSPEACAAGAPRPQISARPHDRDPCDREGNTCETSRKTPASPVCSRACPCCRWAHSCSPAACPGAR
jgi:hypothetical protein